MPKFAGPLFAIGGLIAAIFFIVSTSIPGRELYIVFSIFFVIMGGFLIVQQKIQAFRNNFLGGDQLYKNDVLIKTGEKITVTLDNCEIKSGSFQGGLPVDGDVIARRPASGGVKLREDIQQTYVLFKKEYNGKLYTFISQPTTATEELVKKYLEDNGGIHLYVDKQNPGNYYFDVYG